MPLTYTQILEQIEVIQEVVLPGISKLNNSGPHKKPRDQTQFSQKKGSRKRKMDLMLRIIFDMIPTDGSYYRVINSSIQQDFFHLSQNFCHAIQKKQLEKYKKRININNILKISKLCVMRLMQNQKTK